MSVVAIIVCLITYLILFSSLYPITKVFHYGIKHRLLLPTGVTSLYYIALYISILTDLGLIAEQVFIILLIKNLFILFLIGQALYLIYRERELKGVMTE
jgi:hypothetical protein